MDWCVTSWCKRVSLRPRSGSVYIQDLRRRCEIAPKSNLWILSCTVTPTISVNACVKLICCLEISLQPIRSDVTDALLSLDVNGLLHQASARMKSQHCMMLVIHFSLKPIELLQNELQPHSATILFASIVFNESSVASVIWVLTLTLSDSGAFVDLDVWEFLGL